MRPNKSTWQQQQQRRQSVSGGGASLSRSNSTRSLRGGSGGSPLEGMVDRVELVSWDWQGRQYLLDKQAGIVYDTIQAGQEWVQPVGRYGDVAVGVEGLGD